MPAGNSYETLPAQDQSFFAIEGPALHMHLAVTMVFESGPLSKGAGAVDFAGIRSHIAKRLHLIPGYRQRLAKGLAGEALWVDDERFDLDYHVRHVRLPTPGDDDMLKALCARIMSRPLDRARPLWEISVVEGLETDQFALINKTYHCMIDGLSGVEVIMALLSLANQRTGRLRSSSTVDPATLHVGEPILVTHEGGIPPEEHAAVRRKPVWGDGRAMRVPAPA